VAAALLATLPLAGTARAQAVATDPVLHGSATSLGQAGAIAGSPGIIDNVLVGSAVLALEPRYDVSADGWIAPGGWKGFKVAAVDSRTSNLTLGLVYGLAHTADLTMDDSELPGWQLPDTPSENAATTQHVAGGLAYSPDALRRYSFGLHGGYWWRSAAVAGDGSGIRAGASVAGRPPDTLFLSLGGTFAFLDDDARGLEADPWLQAGLRWQVHEQVALMSDGTLPLDPLDGLDFALASEWAISGLVPLRLGYARTAGQVSNALAAGLGIDSEYLHMYYGIWVHLGSETAPPGHALTVAMQF